MKVLFTFPRQFGYYPHIFEYCTNLRSEGIDCRYVGIDEGLGDGNGTGSDVPVYHISNPGGKISMLREFARKIDEIEPDIVHNFFFRGCGLLPLIVKKSIPAWVVDIRSVRISEGKDYPRFYEMRNYLMWVEAQTYNRILVLTDTLMKKFRNSIGNVTQIPLGASKARLNSSDRNDIRKKIREQLHIPDNAPVFLYAGAPHRSRKVDHLIDAFSTITRQYPDVYFLIIGGSELTGVLQTLKNRVDGYKMTEKIIFTGEVPYRDMHKYFSASDIGLSYMPLDTAHSLQPPTKLIEYMMAGLISVTNKTKETERYIQDEVNGIICGDGVQGFASGMQRALSLLPNSGPIGCKARESVAALDWQVIVTRHLIPLYQRILHNRTS